MSAVVRRCPNCGTTQTAPGECESCQEAEVRYYCPNHSPGRWLDGPACGECGARYGVEPPAPVPRPTPRPAPPPRRERTPPRPAPPLSPPPTPPPPPRGRVEPRPRRPERPGDLLDELLRDARARSPAGLPVGWPGASGAPEEASAPAPPAGGWLGRRPREPRRGAPSLVGCLVRLVVVLVLLALLAVAALVGLVGGPFGAWVVDFGQSTGVVEGVPAQTERGVAAYEAGDYATAERELREAAQAYPRSGLALVYLARLKQRAGDEQQARELLRDAVTREPTSALAHRALADLYYEAARGRALAGDTAAARPELLRARDHYERAILFNPNDALARGYYSCVMAALGDAPEAATRPDCAPVPAR